MVTQRERKPKKAGMCVYAHLVHSGGQQKLTQLCKVLCCCRLVAKLCPALCSPMDCKLPGSSFLGISQVRILGWITISFSKNSNYTPTKINFKNALIHLTLKLSMNRTHRYRNQDETAQDSWETKRRAQKAVLQPPGTTEHPLAFLWPLVFPYLPPWESVSPILTVATSSQGKSISSEKERQNQQAKTSDVEKDSRPCPGPSQDLVFDDNNVPPV